MREYVISLLVSEFPPVKRTVQAHIACWTVLQIRDPRLFVSSRVHIKALVDFSKQEYMPPVSGGHVGVVATPMTFHSVNVSFQVTPPVLVIP